MADQEESQYSALPTLRLFHESPAQIRCVVGPVGSGKTTAATWEVCYYLPFFLAEQHNIKRTRWLIVRNTYSELIDTTQRTVFDWFGWGHYAAQQKIYTLRYPDDGIEVEVLFRSCDRPEDVKKFKSLEITGYWIDESIEVKDEIKLMLKNRIGRYPRKCPVRFGIETTNPPDIESSTYKDFKWHVHPPGPVPEGTPKESHEGFWQPPRENEANLREHYYDDLLNDYADNPDWGEMYVLGKPGVLVRGKMVYANFRRDHHVAKEPLIWAGGTLYRGWDNSGNCPACVVAQTPTAGRVHILREYTTDKMGIVDFTKNVVARNNIEFPDAQYKDWGDPAGANKFSKKDGGFTSNAQLMYEACGVNVVSAEQNMTARIQAVDQALARIDGLLIDPSCTRLINGFLGGYCYPEVQGNPGTFSEKPEKNRFSHPHDALQYLLMKLLRSSPANTSNFTPNRRLTQNVNRAHFRPIRRAA